MYTKRQGCFETNSSSTHAICIPDTTYSLPSHISFEIGEYGWEYGSPAPEDYLYTAILCTYGDTDEELNAQLDILKDVLNRNGISYSFEAPEWERCGEYRYLQNGSIDHSDETSDLVQDLLADEDLLLKFLSGAEICTGNDNSEYSRANDMYNEKAAAGWNCYWKGN